MATNCDVCGNRTNEVKSGGGTEPKGIHIEVDVNGKQDFTRDVLKVTAKTFILFLLINKQISSLVVHLLADDTRIGIRGRPTCSWR